MGRISTTNSCGKFLLFHVTLDFSPQSKVSGTDRPLFRFYPKLLVLTQQGCSLFTGTPAMNLFSTSLEQNLVPHGTTLKLGLTFKSALLCVVVLDKNV